MNRGRRDPEVLLHVGLSWRPAIELCVLRDESKELPLAMTRNRLLWGIGDQ